MKTQSMRIVGEAGTFRGRAGQTASGPEAGQTQQAASREKQIRNGDLRVTLCFSGSSSPYEKNIYLDFINSLKWDEKVLGKCLDPWTRVDFYHSRENVILNLRNFTTDALVEMELPLKEEEKRRLMSQYKISEQDICIPAVVSAKLTSEEKNGIREIVFVTLKAHEFEEQSKPSCPKLRVKSLAFVRQTVVDWITSTETYR